jgi:hypothetical protein
MAAPPAGRLLAVVRRPARSERAGHINLFAGIIKQPARGVPIPIIVKPPRLRFPHSAGVKKKAVLFSELSEPW